MTGLTVRQEEVLQAIREFINKYGYSPTLRDLAERLEISYQATGCHLEALERKGEVSREIGKSRSIKLTKTT